MVYYNSVGRSHFCQRACWLTSGACMKLESYYKFFARRAHSMISPSSNRLLNRLIWCRNIDRNIMFPYFIRHLCCRSYLNINNGCISRALCLDYLFFSFGWTFFNHTNHWVSFHVSVWLTWAGVLWRKVCRLLREHGSFLRSYLFFFARRE